MIARQRQNSTDLESQLRHFIAIVQILKSKHGADKVRLAVETALSADTLSSEAVKLAGKG